MLIMKKYVPRYHATYRKVTYTKSHSNHKGILILLGWTLLTMGVYLSRPSKFEEVKLVSPKPDISVQAKELEQPLVEDYTPTEGWSGFVQAVHKVAPLYNFPENVVLAQGALESQRGNSRFSKERNNYLGIGAYDENVEAAFKFENSEQCVIEYMRIIKKNFPEAWANRDNPEKLLYHLKHSKNGKMYATDSNYINKVMSMKEWN